MAEPVISAYQNGDAVLTNTIKDFPSIGENRYCHFITPFRGYVKQVFVGLTQATAGNQSETTVSINGVDLLGTVSIPPGDPLGTPYNFSWGLNVEGNFFEELQYIRVSSDGELSSSYPANITIVLGRL